MLYKASRRLARADKILIHIAASRNCYKLPRLHLSRLHAKILQGRVFRSRVEGVAVNCKMQGLESVRVAKNAKLATGIKQNKIIGSITQLEGLLGALAEISGLIKYAAYEFGICSSGKFILSLESFTQSLNIPLIAIMAYSYFSNKNRLAIFYF